MMKRNSKMEENGGKPELISSLMVLPDDCLVKICYFLSGPEILNVITTINRRFCAVIANENLWYHFCITEKGINFKGSMTWQALYKKDLSKICFHLTKFQDAVLPQLLNIFENRKNVKCSQKNCSSNLENVWLCTEMRCNFVGCGRRDNKHALLHYKNTGHPLALKLNSTEMWCYSCSKWCGSPKEDPIEQEKVRYIRSFLEKYCNNIFVPTVIEQRRQVERSLPLPENCSKRWAILEMSWERDWERFIIGDFIDFSRPIENKKLLNDDGTIRSVVEQDRDFVTVSMEAWTYFAEIYGGGPLIVYDWEEKKWIVDPDGDYMSQSS